MLWRNLGQLLEHEWGRFSEAEEAYRSAIEAGEQSAWHNLGWLLAKLPPHAIQVPSGVCDDPSS